MAIVYITLQSELFLQSVFFGTSIYIPFSIKSFKYFIQMKYIAVDLSRKVNNLKYL